MTGPSVLFAAGGTAPAAAGSGSAHRPVDRLPAVRRVVTDFYRLARDDRGLRQYFRADLDELERHQVAQLAAVLDGQPHRSPVLDWIRPLPMPPALYHRAAFYLVRALDHVYACHDVVMTVASALAGGRCRIIGGEQVPRALVPAAEVV